MLGYIFAVFHHSTHGQHSWKKFSLVQYEHEYQPWLPQWAMEHCQLPFGDMHHLPTKEKKRESELLKKYIHNRNLHFDVPEINAYLQVISI